MCYGGIHRARRWRPGSSLKWTENDGELRNRPRVKHGTIPFRHWSDTFRRPKILQSPHFLLCLLVSTMFRALATVSVVILVPTHLHRVHRRTDLLSEQRDLPVQNALLRARAIVSPLAPSSCVVLPLLLAVTETLRPPSWRPFVSCPAASAHSAERPSEALCSWQCCAFGIIGEAIEPVWGSIWQCG